ncbi:MAG: phospholipase D-like domain-containing protein [Saprospiraceae bacterium]|nr:phospholipase D-like domain-containing protein [Saprospiraceae bacterium]
MMKYPTLLFLFVLATALDAQTVALARQQPLGTVVTVRGIVTNGPELGSIRYLQDHTAGIAAFPGSGSVPGFSNAVKAGDSIEVTGPLVDFNGLLEISPVQSFQVLVAGLPLPEPRALTSLLEVNESLEGQLISVPCTQFAAGGSVFNTNGTYDLTDSDGNVSRIFLRSGHPLIGSSIPGEPVLLTAIASQFIQSQLLPRYATDLQPSPCFYFSKEVEAADFGQTSLSITWKTNLTSPTILLWGDEDKTDSLYFQPGPATSHSATLNNLSAGTLYNVQAVAVHNSDTIRSQVRVFSTTSTSTGRIKIFFNQPVDETVAAPFAPDGDSFDACLEEIFNRIDSACCTIDLAYYNNNRNDIVSRLNAAHTRGVRVRYVAAINASSSALQPPPPFQVLYGNDLDLMHNKFMVCDAELPDKAWVVTGSMNWTTENMTKDYNNMLCFQDQSLARSYVREFEEMWGSSSAVPDTNKSLFGSEKTDNTPHQFRIGGVPVSLWFSPSDGTTGRIRQALETSEHSLLFALLTFTRDELAIACTDAHNRGVDVRGLIENTGDQGSEFGYLTSNGIQVFTHTQSGSLHHKYAVIDAANPDSGPLVVTGSHNWSSVAEERNDENTLIIADERVSRLFLAEFERRWAEVATALPEPGSNLAAQVIPNPACDRLRMQMPVKAAIARLYDSAGGLRHSFQVSEQDMELPIGFLPQGWYMLQVIEDNGHATTIPFQKICR